MAVIEWTANCLSCDWTWYSKNTHGIDDARDATRAHAKAALHCAKAWRAEEFGFDYEPSANAPERPQGDADGAGARDRQPGYGSALRDEPRAGGA